MSNNKKAYNIHQLWVSANTKFSLLFKHMQPLQMYWKIYVLVYEYVRICYLSKYSKYAEASISKMLGCKDR
jgi:hypothetical protein